jgi:tetratricopeptide (TPR) repeat protein
MASIDQALNAARAKDQAGDLRGAMAVLDATPGAQRTGAWHYARGAMALRSGEVAQAVTLLEKAVALEPEVPEYGGNLGAALLEQAKAGAPDAARRAREVLERAARWRPTLPTVHTNLCLARLATGDAAGALEAADQALTLDPGHLPARFNRAAALEALGRRAEAMAALDALLALAPGLAPAVASRDRLRATSRS